jgi:hypothetical protein
MANRHAHKKLRAEIRARMARTGESFQAARNRIVSRAVLHAIAVDLVPFSRFGVPMTLATFEGETVDSFAVLGQVPRLAASMPRSFLVPTMRFLRPRGVN